MMTIVLFLLGTITTDSSKNYEQLTANYFFETILKSNYNDFRLVEFDNKSDTTVYIGFVYSCESWRNTKVEAIKELKELKQPKGVKEITLTKPSSVKIKTKKISDSRHLKLKIGTMIQLGDNYLVPFIVYEPREFVDHYFLKFDKDGRIIDKCEIREIM